MIPYGDTPLELFLIAILLMILCRTSLLESETLIWLLRSLLLAKFLREYEQENEEK